MAPQKSIVIQTGNKAARDVIGGDQWNVNLPAPSIAALTVLLEKLSKEQENDERAKEVIAELLRFQEPKEPTPIGLEKKLADGGRSHHIEFALEAKECFVKKLAKNTLFESAQEIHVFVLGRIYTVFRTHIATLISQGASLDVVDAAVRTLIIEPLVAELQETSFRYYDEEVYGMLFYLTGNCYIRWT